MSKARERLSLMVVRFPPGQMKSLTPTKAVVADILKASDPQGMQIGFSPLQASKGDDPQLEYYLNHGRQELTKDGVLIYLCDGNRVLAGILFYDSQMMYIQDAKGQMTVVLSCYPEELVKMLREQYGECVGTGATCYP